MTLYLNHKYYVIQNFFYAFIHNITLQIIPIQSLDVRIRMNFIKSY